MDVWVRDSFQKFDKALKALKKMVDKPMESDRSNVNACMQRFEFTIKLLWKLLKRIMEAQGRK